jgi:sortase A
MSQIAVDTIISRRHADTNSAGSLVPAAEERPSFALWSKKRIREYEQSLVLHFAPPLAILAIPAISVEVPVFNGTDDLTLNRGVGRIIGTAQMASPGNIGIAGHRDGFFRGLKVIKIGDKVELKTEARTLLYRVSSIQIVTPDNVAVLENTGEPSLTLVTCYPFYFVGDAPQRYIVHCSFMSSNE